MHILTFSQHHTPVELLSNYYTIRFSPVWDRYRSVSPCIIGFQVLFTTPVGVLQLNSIPQYLKKIHRTSMRTSHKSSMTSNHEFFLYNQVPFFTCSRILSYSKVSINYPCESFHNLGVIFTYIFLVILWVPGTTKLDFCSFHSRSLAKLCYHNLLLVITANHLIHMWVCFPCNLVFSVLKC